MDGDVTGLLACAGAVLVMVLYWTYYIWDVRREPRSEAWYDDSDFIGAKSDGVLFIYPYCSLITGAAGVMVMVESVNLPEIVNKVLIFPFAAAFVIGAIGFTGAVGVPLPWPFVPHWVVGIRRKSALDGARREAKRRGKEE